MFTNNQSYQSLFKYSCFSSFAIITSYVLVSYDSQEDKFVSNDISRNQLKEALIKKVIDKDPCHDQNENINNKNHECK